MAGTRLEGRSTCNSGGEWMGGRSGGRRRGREGGTVMGVARAWGCGRSAERSQPQAADVADAAHRNSGSSGRLMVWGGDRAMAPPAHAQTATAGD